MQTQSRTIGENWSHIRDHQTRGISSDDARELFHITQVEYEPPSRAHRKRLARPRLVVHKRKAVPPAPPCPKKLAHNRTRELALSVVAISRPNFVAEKLGQPLEPNRAKAGPMFSAKHCVVKDEDMALAKKRNLRRDHFRALGRMAFQKWTPTLDNYCEIFALFGNFANFEKECSHA